MSGWIKIHTKLLDWEWASCPETMALWVHILLHANYEDKRWRGITIPRGSFITSIKELASAAGLTIQQTRTSLGRLISTNEITRKSTNQYTMISVCKYDNYQLKEDSINKQNNELDNKRITNEQQTDNKQITTTAELKTLSSKKDILSKERTSKESFNDIVSEIEKEGQVCNPKTTDDLDYVAPELKDIFNEFLAMRRKIRKPLKTPKGIKDRYNNLIKLSGGDIALAKAIAEQTLSHEWLDFFELHDNKRNKQTNNQPYTNDKYW